MSSNIRQYASAFLCSANGYARDVLGIRYRRICLLSVATLNSVYSPIFGCTIPKCWQIVSVAFCPVVTMAEQLGIFTSNASMSVGVTTSRNLSEALSAKRLTAHAVS